MNMPGQASMRTQSSIPASADDHSQAPLQNRLTSISALDDDETGRGSDGPGQNQVQFVDLFNCFENPVPWLDFMAMSGFMGNEAANSPFSMAGSPARMPSRQSIHFGSHQNVHIQTMPRQEEPVTTVDPNLVCQSSKPWMRSEHSNTMSSNKWNISSDALMPEKVLNAIPPPHINGNDLSQRTHQLLQHYRTHVCEAMMPTSAPKLNPYLRLYLPLAVQDPNSPAKQALLDAILAVAAFNKSQLTPGQRRLYRDQATDHHDQAASMINTIISRKQASSHPTGESPECKHALLAAALTLTTIEVFSGANEGRGYEYLLLCRTVLELTGGQRWWLSNSASITLLQIFQCLHIVGRTSGWFESPSRQLDDIEAEGSSDSPVAEAGGRPVIGHVLLQAPQTYAPEYTLDISFGISINTLSHLHKVIMLSKVKSSLSPGQGWPSSAQEELARLEKEMFTDMENSCLEASSSRSPSPSLEGVSQYVANEIKEDHMLAFHYSTALFFRRALCDGTGRIVPALYGDMVPREPRGTPLPSGQHLVSKALEHLENIDALAGDLAIANTLWPGFIAAAEAVDWKLRRRALMWFGRAKRHGIGNITKAKALVQEIWRRVDRLMLEDHETHPELGPVDWREVMNDMNMYIMLT